MPQINVSFKIDSEFSALVDVFMALKNLDPSVREIKFDAPREPLTLKDYNHSLVRPAINDEDYRVVIPGLGSDGTERTVPVYEDDLDEVLLERVLADQNLERFVR